MIERSAHVSLEKPDPTFLKDLSTFMEELFRDQANTGTADYVVASEDYFQTLGIPLLKGRVFNQADGPDAPQVAVISESVAHQHWPNQDPLGHTIEFGNIDGDLRLLTVVVKEVRKQSLETAPRPSIYVNYRQRLRSVSEFDVVLRTNSDQAAMFSAMRGVALRYE